jgi:hypothetical protein
MATISLICLILMCVGTSVGWTRSDHWQTTLSTSRDGRVLTTSIAVYPTASVSATSTNTSTTLVTGGFDITDTYPLTVTDLFYPPGASVCVSTGFKECSSTPTYIVRGSITTNYYVPFVVSNPSSCTKTSFLYTTSQTVYVQSMIDSIPNVVDQATGSAEALFVTTYVSTLSTNLGGQAVTTSICDVYLKGGEVLGLIPGDEAYPLSQCVDPRVYLCSANSAERAIPKATCQTTGQVYPPAGQAGVVGGSDASPTTAGSPTKTGGAGGLTPLAFKIWVLLAFPGYVLLFGSLY